MDNLNKRRPQDAKRININQPHEVGHWTVMLKVTEAKLKEAVKAAGPMVVNVERWLSENKA